MNEEKFYCFDCNRRLSYDDPKIPSPAQFLNNGSPICSWCENDRFHSYEGFREEEELLDHLKELPYEIEKTEKELEKLYRDKVKNKNRIIIYELHLEEDKKFWEKNKKWLD